MFTYKKDNQLPIKSWIPEEDYNKEEGMYLQFDKR